MAAAIIAPASSTSPRPSGHGSCSPRTCSFLPLGRLNTKLVKMQAAMAPRLRHSYAIRAQNGAAGQPFVPDPDMEAEFRELREMCKKDAERPPDMPFREEIVKMDELDFKKMTRCDSSFLHMDARASALCVFWVVKYAIEMASDLMVSAGLRLGLPGEISLDTIKQTLSIYVHIFVSIVDDTCQRKTTRETFVSFLDALGGVAAISHILLEDTLANLNDNGYGLSDYSPFFDEDRARHEFRQELNNLKHKFRTALPCEAYEVLIDTLIDATVHTKMFLIQMTCNRKMALRQVQGGPTGSPDGGESDDPDSA